MEAELKEKDVLISTYTTKLREWEKVFRKLKEDQREALDNVLAVTEEMEEEGEK